MAKKLVVIWMVITLILSIFNIGFAKEVSVSKNSYEVCSTEIVSTYQENGVYIRALSSWVYGNPESSPNQATYSETISKEVVYSGTINSAAQSSISGTLGFSFSYSESASQGMSATAPDYKYGRIIQRASYDCYDVYVTHDVYGDQSKAFLYTYFTSHTIKKPRVTYYDSEIVNSI
jgi:hypothetical protein